MKKYLLPEDGQFYRANLHAHTTISDGKLSPEELRDFYKAHGYSIVAYTDHHKYVNHTELNQPDFLALPAVEVDINQKDVEWNETKTYHINLYDTQPDMHLEDKKDLKPKCAYDDIEAINQYIDKMNKLGFLVCYNHPYWSLQDSSDYTGLKGLFAMEIYNHGCEHDGLYGYHPQAYSEMLRAGQRLFCLSTDDNHNTYPENDPLCDSFGGFNMIKAKDLTFSSVVEAMKNGEFYSSTGPEIYDLYIEDGTVHIKCSPVEKIFMLNQGRNTQKLVVPSGETITEAAFKLNGSEKYIWFDCRDYRGFHAYTNAYFL